MVNGHGNRRDFIKGVAAAALFSLSITTGVLLLEAGSTVRAESAEPGQAAIKAMLLATRDWLSEYRNEGDNDFEGVGCCAEDAADFRADLDLVQDVDGKGILEKNAEHVSRPDGLQRPDTRLNKAVIIAFRTNKAGA